MSESFKIFIVEDDKIFAKMLAHYLSHNNNYETHIFPDGKTCLDNLYQRPSVISLDYNLPDMSGLEILKRVKDFDPDLPVVIVSGQQDVQTALQLLKLGAYDYVLKEDDTKEKLWNLIKNIHEHEKLKRKVSKLEEEVGKKYEYSRLIKGNSPAIHRVFNLIERAVKTNINVSITGETGSGKDLVAKAIHYNSPRRNEAFVAVNVSAIPSELIESEMFGHERGAFTGAHTRRIGRFEEASQGTLFLDEIADMDMNMQAKLLRVIQENEITRIGSNKTIKLDVRLIVASNKDLRDEVSKGNFREDLYYRLLGLPIELPPLRQRGNDIILLARFFINEFCKANKMNKMALSPEAAEKIKKYPFPGNVRELKAVVELAAVMANNDIITAEEISFSSPNTVNDFLVEETTLEDYNRKIIKHFLKKYDNKVRLVASKLGIGKTTIYRLINENKI